MATEAGTISSKMPLLVFAWSGTWTFLYLIQTQFEELETSQLVQNSSYSSMGEGQISWNYTNIYHVFKA